METQTAQTQDIKAHVTFGEVAPLGKLIFSVAKQLRRAIEQQARVQDMTLPQWRALTQVHHSDGLSQAALASLIETDPMTTSKIVRLLEARGLIERLPDPADSRAKIVRVTPPVADMVAAMKTIVGELHDTMLLGVSEADKQALVRSLNTISENLAGQGDRLRDVDK